MNFWGLFYCFSNVYNKKNTQKNTQKNFNFVAKKLVTLCYDRSRALQWGFKALFIFWGLIYRFYQKKRLKNDYTRFLGISRRVYVYTPSPFLRSATIAYPFSKFFYFFYFFIFGHTQIFHLRRFAGFILFRW